MLSHLKIKLFSRLAFFACLILLSACTNTPQPSTDFITGREITDDAGRTVILPLKVDRNSLSVEAEREPNLRLLSESDVEALEWAFANYAHLSFDDLRELSHREEAYINAEGDRIRYEDMLEP